MRSEPPGTSSAPPGISRRRVVAGAAWSVPAITLVNAAPAVASSQPPVFPDLDAADACKIPGDNLPTSLGCWKYGYVLFVDFKNTFDYTVYVTVTDIRVEDTDMELVGTTLPGGNCSQTTSCIAVPPATNASTPGSTLVAIFGNASTDSASNVNVAVDYRWHNESPCVAVAASASVNGDVTGGSPWTVNGNATQAGGSCDRPGNCVIPPTLPACP